MTTPQLQRLRNEHFLPETALRVFHNRLLEPFPIHWHEFYELGFVQRGTGTHVLNGAARRLARGSLFFLTPADFHELLPDRGEVLELYNVVFGDEVLEEAVRQLLFGASRVYAAELRGSIADDMEREFRRLATECEERPLGFQYAIHATVQRILVDLARHGAGAAQRANLRVQQPTIRDALAYIHRHFRSPLTLEQAAAQAHLSPNYFSECFRQATGTPFQTYLQELRLRFAMAMLSASHVPVTDICHAAGFSTLSHFEKAFKRKFGRSPRAYRESIKAEG